MSLSDITSIMYTVSVILYTVVSIRRIILLENQNRAMINNIEAVTLLCDSLIRVEKEKAEEQSKANGKAD